MIKHGLIYSWGRYLNVPLIAWTCGDTLKEKTQEAVIFCRHNGMTFPFRCGKDIYSQMDCWGTPLSKLGAFYKLDESIDDCAIVDDNGFTCLVI